MGNGIMPKIVNKVKYNLKCNSQIILFSKANIYQHHLLAPQQEKKLKLEKIEKIEQAADGCCPSFCTDF